MASSCTILDLPDLILHNICRRFDNPIDLMHLGGTCTQLRRITSAPSLWFSYAFQWLEGLWIYIDSNPDESHPREWFLEILRGFSIRRARTELKCEFSNGEQWKRVESVKFRCLVNMLRLAYERNKDHPAVLYEQWLYDIGLYRRVNVRTDYTCQNLEFSKDVIDQLIKLGQAEERDLRRRKQPNKDLKYYIKRVHTSEEEWMTELFPAGPYGSICPLIVCPLQNAATKEVSGLQGLSTCLCIALSKILRRNKALYLPLRNAMKIIKTFCSLFIKDLINALPSLETRFGKMSLISAVLYFVNENNFNKDLQNIFTLYNTNLTCENVLREFLNFLQENEGIDMIVDKWRRCVRESTYKEINYVLFQNNNNNAITRINLTDSDMIGGDNSRQEMSAAAFVSQTGVLVTWQLIGKIRF